MLRADAIVLLSSGSRRASLQRHYSTFHTAVEPKSFLKKRRCFKGFGMSAEQGEWKTVTKDDKKRVMRRGGRRADRVAVVHSSPGQAAASSVLVGDSGELLQILLRCKELLAETSFFRKLMQSLEDALSREPGGTTGIQEMVVYGIGNFSQTSRSFYSAAIWQLACVMLLRQELESSVFIGNGGSDDSQTATKRLSVLYFDPCSNAFEDSFLVTHLDVEVQKVNERGNRPVKGVPTLFFMPHCPSFLYENVIWANWQDLQVGTLVFLIGNSLLNQAEYCSLQSQENGWECIKAIVPWLHEIQLDNASGKGRKATNLPGNYVGAFNDTYLVCRKDQTDHSWPRRPYDELKVLPEENYVL